MEELGYFKCILLSSSKLKDLLKILYHLGISRHTLMPSLENAAKAYEYPKKLYDWIINQRKPPSLLRPIQKSPVGEKSIELGAYPCSYDIWRCVCGINL